MQNSTQDYRSAGREKVTAGAMSIFNCGQSENRPPCVFGPPTHEDVNKVRAAAYRQNTYRSRTLLSGVSPQTCAISIHFSGLRCPARRP